MRPLGFAMSLLFARLLAATVLLLAWTVSLYNALLRLKHRVSKTWANIGALSARRFNFISAELLRFSDAETADIYLKNLFG